MSHRFEGEILDLPSDKSISHRSALIAALAKGTTHIERFSTGLDNQTTLTVLQELGLTIREYRNLSSPEEPYSIEIHSEGLWSFKQPKKYLQCNNSGSTIRMLAGILSAQPFCTTLVGDASLMKRPMKRIQGPLMQMGAQISLSPNGTAPVQVCGTKNLIPSEFNLPIASAQVKSAIIFAALHAEGETRIQEPLQTRNHTELMLGLIQNQINQNDQNDSPIEPPIISIQGPFQIEAKPFKIPADPSAACFLVALGLLATQAHIAIRNVCLNQTRTGFLKVVKRGGANLTFENKRIESGEQVGDIIISNQKIASPLRLEDPTEVANVIDEIPMLSVLSAFSTGSFFVTNAKELRAKECDRISALVQNLQAMGFICNEWPEGFEVIKRDREPKTSVAINTFHDHRIAMAFEIIKVAKSELIDLSETASIPVSFPNFFNVIKKLKVA
ncbi:MAG: 3-phosphoshikimate 1-carboxyvinyltransferase [Chloroherpetonaceae bacterium]|nr:3-phosphoshikimate 1-carboxyvinyltransferase [Chloroherpetonaceae bacterium]